MFEEQEIYIDPEKLKKMLPKQDPDVWKVENRYKMREELAFKLF